MLGDTEKGKVTLLVNLTFNEKLRKESEKELDNMKYLCQKYD